MTSALAIAGCTSDDGDSDVQDSDGDGVIDSQDYAPRDADVQRESDVRAADTATADRDGTTPSGATADAPAEVTYPSHAGTHSISARDNFWAWEFSVGADFVLEYRAVNLLDENYDFDVLLYPPERFEEYRAIANEVREGIRPQYLDGSAPGVRSGVERRVQMPAGTYYLVLDNTDLSDAGDWGTEETRRVRLEAETGSV